MPAPIALIGNPRAGRGRGRVLLERLAHSLEARGHPVLLLPTRGPGDACIRAAEAMEAAPAAIGLAGGDGTIRDVAEGLVRAGRAAPLALFPSGTGNDLARSLGVPGSREEQIKCLLSGIPRRLDAWLFGDRVFVNAAAVGLDAAVGDQVNRRLRAAGGMLAYLLGFLLAFPRFRPFPVTVSWPGGGYEGRVWLSPFASAPAYGGGMQVAPGARVDDGLLDLVLIEEMSRPALLLQFPRLIRGTHLAHPKVRIQRAAWFDIQAAAVPVTLDGESIGSVPAKIRLAEIDLTVLLPARIDQPK